LQTIDIFERTKAKVFSVPRTRKWTIKESVPLPTYVNLKQVANGGSLSPKDKRQQRNQSLPANGTNRSENNGITGLMSNGGESDMMQQMVLTPSQKTLKESMLKATQM